MRRRVRRIAPPYLASLVFVLCVAFLAGWMRGGWPAAWSNLALGPVSYLQNFTLTQWVAIPMAHLADAEGPVTAWENPALMVSTYWSLNYEEQFYLVCGLVLAA